MLYPKERGKGKKRKGGEKERKIMALDRQVSWLREGNIGLVS